MKFLIALLVILQSAWALDYDPKFHIKHRYNNHPEAVTNPKQVQAPQKMEASETSKEPLRTTPNVRKIFRPNEQE